MSKTSLVVVGASLAGLRAVDAARKSGFAGRITLVGAESHLPYDRPPLSKAYLDSVDGSPESPTFRDERVLRDELDVTLGLGTPATALDTAGRRLHLGDRQIQFDALAISTGADARPLSSRGHLKGVYTLRTLDDARAIRAGLDARARTVVIGEGSIAPRWPPGRANGDWTSRSWRSCRTRSSVRSARRWVRFARPCT